MSLRFSEFFNINKTQAELDFVDVPLEADMRLFVDPYAISIKKNEWFDVCTNKIVSFFEALIESIRIRDRARSAHLLSHLHEPNDTRLGLSKGKPTGRGIGNTYAKKLFQRLYNSKAAQTGQLSDLSDCELMIKGIGADRISDMTINIIREQLISYTQYQCELWGIPTNETPAGIFWDENDSMWKSRYAYLPMHNSNRILLIPKLAVRLRLLINHSEFYRKHIVDYLQAEHLAANTGLVTVLKNKKRVVRKKDINRVYPGTKENIASFAEKHPQLLTKYKKKAESKSTPLLNETIEGYQARQKLIDYDILSRELENIEAGHKDAVKYHNYIKGALEAIFYPQLLSPVKEKEIHDGRKRIDIRFTNAALQYSFYDRLIRVHKIPCPYILFECKNYNDDIANPEFDQITGRFSPTRGKFGIIICRMIKDKALAIQRCKDIINDRRGYVLILDDSDIKTLLSYKKNFISDDVTDYMNKKIEEVLF